MNSLTVHCVIMGFDGHDLVVLTTSDERAHFASFFPFGRFSDHETAEDTARRVVFEFTGLKGLHAEQLHTFSTIDPVSSNLHISISYLVLAGYGEVTSGRMAITRSRWRTTAELESLGKEEGVVIKKARILLRQKTNVYSVIAGMLEGRFTFTQLQNLYNAIFETEFDKRNFYKSMMSLGILKRQDEKEKTSSKKGAFYYVLTRNNAEKAVTSMAAQYDTTLKPKHLA